MTLCRADFAAFFAAVHDGHGPFRWQERLLDHVVTTGRWPDLIDAPTGAGKTAAIDVHVFALALAAATGASLPPRRLSMVVGRRVLVDDQYEHADALRSALGVAAEPVVKTVAQQLWSLRESGDRQGRAEGASPLVVARLRGGEPPSRSWMDEPSAAAVICATPDMWGSRLLFRGYGASQRSWPRAAGLLAVDSVAVVDEAHLAAQLLTTARRVGELVPVAAGEALGPASLQVVETSATPTTTGDVSTVGVEQRDLAAEPVLADRLTRPKPVTLVSSADWTKVTPRGRAVTDLATATAELIERGSASPEGSSGTVGCFVNTVGRAVAVAQELRARSLRVVLLCGQVRPIDVTTLRREYEGLLDTRGDPAVDVIVSTQTLEVGVDLDLAGIVTELAGGSALAQRAGRANRLGRRDHGPIIVVGPAEELKDGARSGPYDTDELREALTWVRRRAADPAGLAPWTIHGDRPEHHPRRSILQRPEWAQAEHWARTSNDLAADPELDLWLSEDVERPDDLSLGLVVRERLPVDDNEACALIAALLPRRHESFPLPFVTARDALARAHGEGVLADPATPLRAFVVRGDEVVPLMWTDRGDGADRSARGDRTWRPQNLRPGDTVVVDAATPLFAHADLGPHVLVPAGDETTRHPAPDALESEATPGSRLETLRVGGVVHRIDLTDPDAEPPERETAEQLRHRHARAALRDDLATLDPDGDAARRAVVGDWLVEHGASAMARCAAELLDASPRKVDVTVLGDADAPRYVLVIDRRRAVADEDVRQEWTPETDAAGVPPSLESHQTAVAARAEALGTAVGLRPDLVDALREGGALHDEGKRDARFQTRLGARADDAPLAKGRASTPRAARLRESRACLPAGWRHEQLSVVAAWARPDHGPRRDLVARLVGTSHGSGRAVFPHTAAELTPAPGDDTRVLFDQGEWDEVIDRTHRLHGLWGCAYLEALLRAADGQVSGEGR